MKIKELWKDLNPIWKGIIGGSIFGIIVILLSPILGRGADDLFYTTVGFPLMVGILIRYYVGEYITIGPLKSFESSRLFFGMLIYILLGVLIAYHFNRKLKK